eukprot:PhM_4_TR11644/c3_g1_i2/m.68015
MPVRSSQSPWTTYLFPVPEFSKGRRRLIKHTRAYNDLFGKDSLLGIKMLSAKALPDTVHRGQHVVTLDFSAWYDQFRLAEEERPYHCFQFHGKWYRLCVLAMGQRQAVDIAHTATQCLAAFDRPAGVFVDTYIDNLRFQGDNLDDVVQAATTFVLRARLVGATINEVSNAVPDDTLLEFIDCLSHTTGEF